jgi:hypothetical protein
MNLQKLNRSKAINLSTFIFIAFISLFALASFAQYHAMRLQLDNPLTSNEMVKTSTMPFLKKGIVLSIGLLLIFIAKHFKKSLLAFVTGIFLIAYYIFSGHYIGGWHTGSI